MAPLGAFFGLLLASSAARATPGRALRLSGVQAQGPATRSVTAIHHNPAMLGAIPGFAFELTLRGGVDHRVASREGVDDSGLPNGSLGPRRQFVDPVAGGFLGGSFMLDPVAIGIGVYDLSNRYRYDGHEDFRYQHSDSGAVRGGSLDLHHDFSLAVAWNATRRFRLGGAVHFPVLHQSMARDDDTFLTGVAGSEGGVGCGTLTGADAEDPACAESIFVRTTSARFNLNATFGVAVLLDDDWTLGLRYRSRPWLTKNRVQMSGQATVCLPDEAADAELYATGLSRCSDAGSGSADAQVLLPREVAVGVAGRFGRQRQWQLDTNLYWIDRCDGLSATCSGRDGRSLSLVGLGQDAAILPESQIYRGYADVFGLELWGRYRLNPGPAWPPRRGGGEGSDTQGAAETGESTRAASPGPRLRSSLLFGAGFSSPGVRAGSTTIVESERWQLSANIGARFLLRRRGKRRQRGSWFFAPGYGLDLGLPSRVGSGGQTPAYDPGAALEFAASGRDINGPGADAVLAGRARPSNAGRYQQTIHTVTFSVGWSEVGF